MKLTRQEYAVLDRLVRKTGIAFSECAVKASSNRSHVGRGQKTGIFMFRPQCECVSRQVMRPEKVDRWSVLLEAEIQKSRTGPSLSRLICEFLGDRNPAEVYKKIGMSRQTFNNIRTCRGSGNHQKSKILQLAIGLELSLVDAERLMSTAGLAFSGHDPTDVVVRFCIKSGKWDPACVDQALVHYNLPALFSKV